MNKYKYIYIIIGKYQRFPLDAPPLTCMGSESRAALQLSSVLPRLGFSIRGPCTHRLTVGPQAAVVFSLVAGSPPIASSLVSQFIFSFLDSQEYISPRRVFSFFVSVFVSINNLH